MDMLESTDFRPDGFATASGAPDCFGNGLAVSSLELPSRSAFSLQNVICSRPESRSAVGAD